MWPFRKTTPLPEVVLPVSVKPSDLVIQDILDERYHGYIPAQWVNWAASQIDMPMKYTYTHPITIKSTWVLYEGCRVYLENSKEV